MKWVPADVAEVAARWQVRATSAVARTPSSDLLFGDVVGVPVVLKVPRVEEEARAGALLAHWSGRGAAPVLRRDHHALLMARAQGTRDLAAWSEAGDDEAATEVLVTTAGLLHRIPAPGAGTVPLVPLSAWFDSLLVSEAADPLIRAAMMIATDLLDSTPAAEVVALHGDVHHGNVLDFGDRFAAIDPKGLLGHRAFDYANILCNPSERTATRYLQPRLTTICRLAGLEAPVLTAWTVAWCGLSLVWEADSHAHSRGESGSRRETGSLGDSEPSRGAHPEPSWHTRTARAVAEQLLPDLTT